MADADVLWTGPPPSDAVAAALRSAGLAVSRRRRTGHDGPIVVSTAGPARAPRAPGPAKWLWVHGGAVAERAQTDAVLHGAYDVVSLRQPDAAALIVERLREMLAPAPDIPPADLIVTASASSRRMIEKVARVAE